MPSYNAVFQPKPGRFGISPAFLVRDAGTSPLTASATTTIRIPTPKRRMFFLRASVSQGTVVVDADGTVLATLKKRDVSAAADVSLTAALSLEGVAALTSIGFVQATGLTDAQLTIDEGDTLFVEVVNNSAAIDTQPVALQFVVEVGVKE